MIDEVLTESALKLRDALRSSNQRLVLAESCTAGAVAAALGSIPGISNWLCGSFVVYRNKSKQQWLDVPTQVLVDPKVGPVSELASRMICDAAIAKTSEAAIAVAITGDIGPNAPLATEGVIFVALREKSEQDQEQRCEEHRMQLSSPKPIDENDVAGRSKRISEAVLYVLRVATEFVGRC